MTTTKLATKIRRGRSTGGNALRIKKTPRISAISLNQAPPPTTTRPMSVAWPSHSVSNYERSDNL